MSDQSKLASVTAAFSGLLHDGVVERDLRRHGEGLAVEMEDHAAIGGLAGGNGGRGSGGDLRHVGAELGQRQLGAEQEDAAVPQEAVGDEAAGALGVGLLDEAGDGADPLLRQRLTRLDVAVTGRRPCRRDAEDDDLASLRGGQCARDGGVEAGVIADDVIGGKNQQRGAGMAAGDEGGGGGDGGRGVAPFRLEQRDGSGAGCGQRRGDEMGMVGAGDHDGRAEQGRFGDALQCQGEGGGAVDQRQEWLGTIATRCRPQARAGAATHNNRNDHGIAHMPAVTPNATDSLMPAGKIAKKNPINR